MQKFVSFIFVVIIGGIFVSFSSLLDQKIAYLPFNPLLNKFYGETSFWCDFIYHLVPVLTTLMIVVPLVILIFYKKTSVIAKRAAIIWLVALALGPGLIVNSLLKNHWGRARPYQVLRDHKTFSPVWQYQSNAPLNNSFCSGHAAIGFFCGIPFLAFRRKKVAIIVSLCGGGIVGVVRILQGGHYLTDVLAAGVVVWVTAFIVIYITDKILQFYL